MKVNQIILKMINKKILKLINIFIAISFGIPFLIMPLAQQIKTILNQGKDNTTLKSSLIQIIYKC